MWILLFSKKSALEKGTLYQLKNLINRTAVPTEPDTNLKVAEDFFLVVLHAHIVAAAEAVLALRSIASVEELAKKVVNTFLNITIPSPDELRHTSQSGKSTRSQSVVNSSTLMVKPLTNHHESSVASTVSSQNTCTQKRTSQSGTNKGKNQHQSQSSNHDGICLYAREVLSLGLIWLEFHDAVKEGDGNRVIQVWKFLLLVFKNSGRKNYSIEALNLLVQEHYILTERQKLQLKWGRFVNIHGRQGCNVPCDLHMEHLNRRL